jgi:NADH:ubiquinone oxidoreductase subunit 2 (subunit N)
MDKGGAPHRKTVSMRIAFVDESGRSVGLAEFYEAIAPLAIPEFAAAPDESMKRMLAYLKDRTARPD